MQETISLFKIEVCLSFGLSDFI